MTTPATTPLALAEIRDAARQLAGRIAVTPVHRLHGKRVGIIVCGSNIDEASFARLIAAE